MAAIQLNFTLRTSGNVKTVHLAGSWDNYTGQLPLSKDASKTGGWKGTFRFPSSTMKQGQRYWYYYIIDGYHVSHDPARESVVEPTTSRRLNILDIPASTEQQTTSSRSSASRHSRRVSLVIPKGNPLPASSIVSPKPYKPGQTRQICAEQFAPTTMEQLAARFASQQVADSDSGSDSESDAESDVPSLSSSRSSSSSGASSRATSPTSSVSSVSSSRCSCQRYGITRAGGRVKLDCGGSRCGSTSPASEEDEECASGSDSEEDEEEDDDEEDSARRLAQEKMLAYRRAALITQQQKQQQQLKAMRRQGMVMRG